ncbi:MAG: hypothetical protein CMF45_00415 [Legionellales bacterium]|nr:hypothetical protein [Legionellales bacterium]
MIRKDDYAPWRLVFVYGTLQRAFGNHRTMQRTGGRFVGTAKTKEDYPLIVSGLPYLLDKEGEGMQVHGEAYLVNDFTHLDALEGHPRFYERKQRDIEFMDECMPYGFYPKQGEVHKAWMYFINSHKPTGQPVQSYERATY